MSGGRLHCMTSHSLRLDGEDFVEGQHFGYESGYDGYGGHYERDHSWWDSEGEGHR